MSGRMADLAVETRMTWMREAGFDELEISESLVRSPPTSVEDEDTQLRAVRRLRTRSVTPPKTRRWSYTRDPGQKLK